MSSVEPTAKRARLLDEETPEPESESELNLGRLDQELNLGRLDQGVLAKILSFCRWQEILRARLCRALKAASLITPVTEVVVVKKKKFKDAYGEYDYESDSEEEDDYDSDSEEEEDYHDESEESEKESRIERIAGDDSDKHYRDGIPEEDRGSSQCFRALGDNLGKLAKILPRIENLSIDAKVAPGIECPDKEYSEAGRPIGGIDIGPLQQFQFLKILSFPLPPETSRLYGAYPVLFSLKSLRTLNIIHQTDFHCDLADFATLPNLLTIHLIGCPLVTGELGSLRHLKHTLKDLSLESPIFNEVTGSLFDLSDFSALTKLSLAGNAEVTGDIRQIKPSHFPSLESFVFTNTEIFGSRYEPTTVAEVHDFYVAWVKLIKHPRPFPKNKQLFLELSESSSDRYRVPVTTRINQQPPFGTRIVLAGPRVGYCWCRLGKICRNTCDVIWLDPEPKPGDEKYDKYKNDLAKIEERHRNSFFRGLTRPPTEEEWRRMVLVI